MYNRTGPVASVGTASIVEASKVSRPSTAILAKVRHGGELRKPRASAPEVQELFRCTLRPGAGRSCSGSDWSHAVIVLCKTINLERLVQRGAGVTPFPFGV